MTDIKTILSDPLNMPHRAQSDVTRQDVVVHDARPGTLVTLDATAADPAASAPAAPAPAPFTHSEPAKPFEILIWVTRPPRKVAGPGQKSKLQKQDPMAFGPLQLDTSVPWDGFLQSLAGEVESALPNLAVPSFEWRLMKPANSPWMPLRSSTGYASLVKQMASVRILRKDTPNISQMSSVM